MNWTLLKNSLLVGGLTALLAAVLGFVAALFLAGLEERWRNRLMAVAVMALALPPFLVTNCWLHFLGPAGVWRAWVPLNIVSLGGTIWILSLLTWPITLLMVLSAWCRLEPSQLESDMAVRGWWLIRGLLWPLARTALGQAAVLTVVLAMNNFAVPAILQVKVFPAEIWVRFNTAFDTPGALRLSWPLVVAPLLLLLWLSRRELPWPRMEGTVPARLFRGQLGPIWLWLCGACTILLCLLAVGLPVYQLASVKRTWTELPGALAAGQSALWNSFFFAAAAATAVILFALLACARGAGGARERRGLAQPDSQRGAGFSAEPQPVDQAALTAAYRPTPSATPVVPLLTELENRFREPRGYKHAAPDGAFLRVEERETSSLSSKRAVSGRPERASSRSRGVRVSDFGFPSAFGFRISDLLLWLAWLLFLLPGVLLGIALISIFNRPWSALLYQSAAIVILAFILRYLALGWNSLHHALRTVDCDLTDAARLEGATRWQMLRYVQWPQVAPQAAAVWYIVFLLCLWDVESMILVVPPGGETLALRVFNLLHYGHNAQVNALCLALLVLAIMPLAAWNVGRVVRSKWSGYTGGIGARTKQGNIQHPTSNIQHPAHRAAARVGGGSLELPTSRRADIPVRSTYPQVAGRQNGPERIGFRTLLRTRMSARRGRCSDAPHVGCWMLDVGCWMFSLCAIALLLAGCTPGTPSNQAPLKSRLFRAVQIVGSRGVGVGQLNKPRSVAVDAKDNLYAVDMTGRVQKFSSNGVFLLSWQMPQTDLGKPKGMCRDRDGNILVLEPHYQRVNVFSPEGKLLVQWGERGTNTGQLMLPRAVAVDSRGEVFVSEYGLVERVQEFAPPRTGLPNRTNTSAAASVVGQASRLSEGRPAPEASNAGETLGRAGGTPALLPQLVNCLGHAGNAPGEFNRPEGLCLDAQDRLYVADSCNHRIQVFSRDGKFIRAYGKPGRGIGELSYPYDICVDTQGRQYVCEFGNSRIQVFDANDKPLEIIGGPGLAPGQFNNPWGVALDSAGNLYVADSQNHRVQKLIR